MKDYFTKKHILLIYKLQFAILVKIIIAGD